MATSKSDKPAADGNAEVQSKMDDALAKGYIGTVPDPHPNEAYSIKSGPDSPPLVEDSTARFGQVAAVTKEATNA
jgi:hypothetical protein